MIAAFVIIQEVCDGALHRRGSAALRQEVFLSDPSSGWLRGGCFGDGLLVPCLRLGVELGTLGDGPCLGDVGRRLR
jgi:hypothetical protein